MDDDTLLDVFPLPDFLLDDDLPSNNTTAKRPFADSSPNTRPPPAPFATGPPITAAPPMIQKRSNDASSLDDFATTPFHFGGHTVGMGKTLSSNSNDSLTLPTSDLHPRKRLRRGGAGGDDDDEDDDANGSSRPISTPHSNITSPADSDHSSTQAITSPPNGESPGVLRDSLARFKVDSRPGSSASSAYGGGGGGNGQQTPSWTGSQGFDDEPQSQPVVIPGIAGKGRIRPQPEATVDSSSPPVQRPGGRLVRGTRPPTVEDSPAAAIGNRSSPNLHTLPLPLPLPSPTPSFPASFPTPPQAGSPSPYFNPSSQPSPYPQQPALSPSFVNSALPQASGGGGGGGSGDPEFDSWAVVMAGSFPMDALRHAWTAGGRDQTRAIGILVGVAGQGPPSASQGVNRPVGQPLGSSSPYQHPSMVPQQRPMMPQQMRQPVQGIPMSMGGAPGQPMRLPGQYGYPSPQMAAQHMAPSLPYGTPMRAPMPPGYGPPNPGQGSPGGATYANLNPQQMQQLQIQQQQAAQSRQLYNSTHQVPPPTRHVGPPPPGYAPQPQRPSPGAQFYGQQPQYPQQPQQPPQPLIHPLPPGMAPSEQYINKLLTPQVLYSIPPADINRYVSPAVVACLTPAQRDILQRTWASVQAHRTEQQKRVLAQHGSQQQQQQRARQMQIHQQQLIAQQQGRGGQLVPRASGSGGGGGGPGPGGMQSLLSRTLAAVVPYGASPKKKKKKKPTSESDGDGGEYSDGSGDEYGGPSPAMIARREVLALEFFNTCSKDELSELAGCNPTQATLVLKLRPFESANDFRTRTRKQKGVGNNLLDNYLEVVEGMIEVDKVLSECEQIGKELGQIMRIWTSGAARTAAPPPPGVAPPRPDTPAGAAAAEVGLSLVSIAEDTVVLAAETSQDPAVRAAFKDYIRKQPDGVPATIVLKDYQMLGLNWLNLLYHRRTSCILADDMGLGKTAQVISLMMHLKSQGEPGPHLVIVPSSTLENWMREFSVFAPTLVVQSYYGSQAERQEIRHELKEMADLDVVVTTYNIASSSPEDQKFLKRKMDFKICVFDEGHQLKNSESKKYKDLMQIRAQWRLLLTGTPLQNNLQELVSLLSFILPEQFRDAGESLRAIFKVTPGAQVNLLSRERITRAKKMMTPFVLRRKKAQVLKDLPNKSERVEWCEMTDLQREVYNEAITRSKMALLAIRDEELETLGAAADVEEEGTGKPKKRGPRASSTKTGNKSDQTSGSNVLMDLRKASNHPMLFRRLYTDDKLRLMARDCLKELEFTDRDKDLIFEDMEVMTDFELHRFCQGYKHLKKYCLQNEEWMSAGKIKTLQRLLPDLKANGDRVLLFSQFTQVLDILELVLQTMGIRYLKLTGQTNVTERQGLVDEYTNDPDITVFLLSTRAGGLGLNLTTANTVILHDMDYNPHNDKQAEDRSYRIGQTRDVTVLKLITRGSLEEDMRALATMKLQLDDSVSSNSQYPTGAGGAPVPDAEGNTAQVEKKMRTSLLSNLKKRFKEEENTQAVTQAGKSSPVKPEQ